MRTTASFHKKKKNIIYISLYDSSECLVFKKVLTRNILETMF